MLMSFIASNSGWKFSVAAGDEPCDLRTPAKCRGFGGLRFGAGDVIMRPTSTKALRDTIRMGEERLHRNTCDFADGSI
jgi:hypothetical protein